MRKVLTEQLDKMESTKEEKTVILDFLPNGYPFDERPMYMKTPVAQALGKEHFVLLELVPKKGIHCTKRCILEKERETKYTT